MHYLLYFDLENDEYKAVHIKDMPTFEDGLTDEISASCFLSASSDSAFIYAYYGGDYNVIVESNPDYRGCIIQFDWNGAVVKKYLIHDAVLTDISYNALTDTFYGLNVFSGDLYALRPKPVD